MKARTRRKFSSVHTGTPESSNSGPHPSAGDDGHDGHTNPSRIGIKAEGSRGDLEGGSNQGDPRLRPLPGLETNSSETDRRRSGPPPLPPHLRKYAPPPIFCIGALRSKAVSMQTANVQVRNRLFSCIVPRDRQVKLLWSTENDSGGNLGESLSGLCILKACGRECHPRPC